MSRLVLGVVILSLCSLTSTDLRAAEPQGEFQSIFNGQDLSGWRGREDLWSVEEGAITGRTTAEKPLEHNTFLVWEGGKPANFELRTQFKIEGGNSGIQYRSQVVDEEKFIVGGYQADIDAAGKYAGINYEERGRGILALRGQRVRLEGGNTKEVESFGDAEEIGKVIKPNEWNDYRIVAQGNRLQHFINGQLTSEVIDLDEEKSTESGVLALQLHVGPAMTVQFKDVKLKQLEAAE
ncbi:3-keto-disaccharide hydrolase [Candidatus Laterigemmans baculatus]|uniref:3-keto-disaccharide hydrolase n=1 Tax=Candidatus Laterigemmans baculatus TaxID=2770505 RepID=UPI0013DB5A99|nr:DUF1080 domain-containing protein [Candidatus Laterigemmans baculatus]